MLKLCAGVLLGYDFLQQYKPMEPFFEGDKPTFSICGHATTQIVLQCLFEHSMSNCELTVITFRRQSEQHGLFIKTEVQKLTSASIIEPSKSSRRDQNLVISNERHKKVRLLMKVKLLFQKPTWEPIFIKEWTYCLKHWSWGIQDARLKQHLPPNSHLKLRK